jgi:hypothetical protein
MIVETAEETKMSIKEEIKELIEYKNLDLGEFSSAWDLYDCLNYDGGIDEIVDGNIDIYNYDLRKWAVDNYNYVDEARDEGLIDEDTDYHTQIQYGQYIYYREMANEALEEIFNEFEPEDEDEDEDELTA